MAMNKTERAEMDALREARDLARSLRWPEYPEPQPLSLEEIEAGRTVEIDNSWGSKRLVCVGWMCGYGGPVEAWSDGHSSGRMPDAKNASQGPGRLYRTRLDALRALRYSETIKYAKALAALDAAIAEAAE